MKRIVLIFLFLSCINGAKKVRYKKAKAKKAILADEDDLYGFLNRITPPRHIIFPDDFPSYTTPSIQFTTSTTTTTTTKKPQKKKLKDYCLKKRGQNGYDPNCHKFVDCWDSTAVLKTCHPPNLVFDPRSG